MNDVISISKGWSRVLTCGLAWILILGASIPARAVVTTNAVVVPPSAFRAPHLLSEYKIPGLEKKAPPLDLLDAMEVVDLIKYLAGQAKLNIVFGKDVAGTTKLVVKDVTLGEALELILASNGLAYEVKGNVIKIMTDKDYQAMYGESFYERKQAKVISLKTAVPSEMAKILAAVQGASGKNAFDDATGTLVLIDSPEKIREMEEVIRRTELTTYQRVFPTVTTNYVLQYAKVEDVEAQVTPMLTANKSIGQMRTDKRTKTLIVTDMPNVVSRIADVVAMFDRPQKQVFIEAKIIQVQLTDKFSFGVNWDYLFQGLDPRFSLQPVVQTMSPLGLTASDRGANVSYHTIAAGADLNSVVRALSTVGKTRLLQNPHIAILDGKEATIKAITTQPYSELQYETGSSNVVGKTYKFVDVGVTLGVTPRINELGFISCDIRPEVSSVLDWYDSNPSLGEGKSGVPVVKKSYAETSITVKDGVTIIIAGMIDEQQTKVRTSVPFFGKIPLLGVLFRSTETTSESTETVVLLTPRIVTGAKFFERSRDFKKPVKGASDATP